MVQLPRLLAVRVLTRVLSDREPLDEALAAVSSQVPTEALAWLQEICSGTLRWKGRLDFVLDSVSLKKRPSGWLRKILLIAAYQLLAQDRAPVGAVVSETVSEIKAKEGIAPSRFANACLRKIADHASVWKEATPEVYGNREEAWASLPLWLWNQLVRDHGPEWTRAFAQATLERPGLWIRAKDEAWRPDWAEAGPIPSSWKVIRGGNPVHFPGFQEGKWVVQDISSQVLISEVLERVKRERASRSVNSRSEGRGLAALDLCAAPGGKSIGMAWGGVDVIATDRSDQRRQLLLRSVERTAPAVKIIPWEERMQLEWPELVWVDAPCSGTGIIRRHPDVKWIRTEKEVEGLAKTQEQLVRETWARLKTGDFLVYSVCSVLHAEGPEVIRKVGIDPSILQIWQLAPHLSPFGDGFWAALLRK